MPDAVDQGMIAHGNAVLVPCGLFRTDFVPWLLIYVFMHERGWKSDVIDRQLDHKEGNKVKAHIITPSICQNESK